MKSILSSAVTLPSPPVASYLSVFQTYPVLDTLFPIEYNVSSIWLLLVITAAAFTYILTRLRYTRQLAATHLASEQIARQTSIIEQQRKVISEQQQLQIQYSIEKRESLGDSKHLANLYQELKQANQDIEIFLYKAYHNFLGPIATIRGICNVAAMESKEGSSLDYFEKVGNVADSMHSMLEQLLEVSVIHDRDLILETTYLASFFDSLSHNLAQDTVYPEIRIKHEFSETDQLRVDTFLLRQALVKIINNTALFRRDSFHQALELTIAGEETEDTLTIMIKDYHLIIPSEVSVDIFRMFYRGTHQANDHGLGLYTARYAVRRMGGDIALTNGSNYTTFCLRLPKRRNDQYQEFLELLAHHHA